MNRNDGGPAFPAHEHHIVMEPGKPDTVKVITGKPHGGMTLRDYFAAKAMAAYIAAWGGDVPMDDVADAAYHQADYMIERREPQGVVPMENSA